MFTCLLSIANVKVSAITKPSIINRGFLTIENELDIEQIYKREG